MQPVRTDTLGLPRRPWLILATSAALLSLVSPVRAVTRTWADLGTDFATAANWGGTAPANNITGDIGSFNSVLNFQPVLAANRSINGLAFTVNATGNITLSGAGAFTLGTGGINNVSTSGLKLINNNLTLGAAQTFTNNGALTIGGNVTNGGFLLTLRGTGTAGSLTGNLGGTGGLTKTGAGSWLLSGTNTYTGATTVSVGSLNLQSNTALGTTAAGTTVANGAALQLQNNITVTGETLSLTGTGVGATGAVRNISGNNIWTGAVTLAGNTTVGSDAGLLTFSGTITNGIRTLTVTGAGDTAISGVIGNGSGGVTKTGTGTLTLSGANTFTGGTTISAGVLNIQNNSALGTAGTGTTVAAGSALQLQNNITVTGEALTLNGTGIASDGALRNISGNNTWTGAITLGSAPGATIQSDAGLLTISGGITGNTRTVTVQGAGDTTLSGIIGTTTGGLVKNNAGTLTLSGNNTFTGATTLNGGTVSINADNRLGTAPGAATANQLVFNGGTLGTTTTFTLNANRGAALSAGGGTFDSASGTTLTYNGIIAGTGGLTKANSGTLVLGGANTYTGATTLNGGILSISADNRLGTAPGSATADQLVFNGGTLATTATMALNGNRSVTLNAGGGSIDVASATTLTFSSTISGSGTLTKLSAGILSLGASTSMGGEFALSAGTLALNGFNFTVGTLHITGNTILDFGNSAASILSATNLVIDTGVTLTINNWINAVDYFYVQNDPGGSAGNIPLNQITFTGGTYTNNDTKWLSYDKQITPAPEPATYGAILAGCATVLLAWRRRRRVLLA